MKPEKKDFESDLFLQKKARRDYKFLALITLVSTIILWLDIITPQGVADAFLYIFPIILTHFFSRRVYIFYTAILITGLIVLGFFLSPPGASLAIALTNKLFGVITIWFIMFIYTNKQRFFLTTLERQTLDLQSTFKQLEGTKRALDRFAIVAETDAKGRITYCNDQFCEISKYTREEILGKDHRDLVNSNFHSKEFWQEFWTTIQSGKIWRGDIRNHDKDGEIYWVDATIVPFLDSAGKIEKFLAIRALITDRKLAEEKMNQAIELLKKTNTELDEFSYIVSHDLKAPLRGIGSVTDWLLQDYADKLDDEGKEHLRALKNRVMRMNGLIEGVLQYSRIGKEKIENEKIDTQILVEDCINLLNPPKHIQITIDHELPQIQALRVQIQQVFQNLLSNAIRYIDKEKGEIHIDCQSEINQWHFTVADNGPGIAEEHFEKIFKIFQTLSSRDKVESTGIGLTIVKKVIDLHGGKIWPESTEGKGTTFHFTLPKSTIN